MESTIIVKALLLQLLLTKLYAVVCVNGDYIHLTVLDGDLNATEGDHHTVASVVETLNSLRRDKRVANMYYVVRIIQSSRSVFNNPYNSDNS